jgi:hypothetical protein
MQLSRSCERCHSVHECECCELTNVAAKSPGIGYYCQRCMGHWGEWQDAGRPGARFQASKDYQAWLDAEHAEMRVGHV